MLLKCDIAWRGIQVDGVEYFCDADGVFDIKDEAHASILLQSPRWTTAPKGVFKEIPKSSKRGAVPSSEEPAT